MRSGAASRFCVPQIRKGMSKFGATRQRDYRGDYPHVSHRDSTPADFASIVIGLRESPTCKDSADLIARGRWTLKQLRRQKRMPNPEIVARWQRSLKSFKRACKNQS
jgi:hypothetical protein